MNVGIIGLGLIGGSLAKSIKKHSGHTVYGYDIDPDAVTGGLMSGAIDEELNGERLRRCRIVLVALYPSLCVPEAGPLRSALLDWLRELSGGEG